MIINAEMEQAARRLGNNALQVRNMILLMNYLESLPEDYAEFDMGEFGDALREPPCGSPACAAGHGPAAGIPRRHEPSAYPEEWSTYLKRVFGLRVQDEDFCFSGVWVDIDNTPRGAAARIRLLLSVGESPPYHRSGRAWSPEDYRLYLMEN